MNAIALLEMGKAPVGMTPVGDFGWVGVWASEEGARVVEMCALMLRNYHVLPEAGGLLDQDPELMHNILTVLGVLNEERQILSKAGLSHG